MNVLIRRNHKPILTPHVTFDVLCKLEIKVYNTLALMMG